MFFCFPEERRTEMHMLVSFCMVVRCEWACFYRAVDFVMAGASLMRYFLPWGQMLKYGVIDSLFMCQYIGYHENIKNHSIYCICMLST